jgi:hypothetical protein
MLHLEVIGTDDDDYDDESHEDESGESSLNVV